MRPQADEEKYFRAGSWQEQEADADAKEYKKEKVYEECPLCGDYLGYWSDENPQCPGCKHVVCDWMFDMAKGFVIKDELVQKIRKTLQHCIEYIDDCCVLKSCSCGGRHSQWVKNALHDFDTGLCLLEKGDEKCS